MWARRKSSGGPMRAILFTKAEVQRRYRSVPANRVKVTHLTTKRQHRLITEGLCRGCGKVPPLANRVLCETCHLKQSARTALGSTKHWEALRDILISQGYRCTYTGQVLELGVNASVDHILPKSRYPERRFDITNIEWISRGVNVAKNAQTPEEFLALVASIHQYRH